MKNKNVGYLISGISLIIIFIIWIFNKGFKDIVSATCSHGPSCSMYSTISMQTWLSLGIALLVLVIGLFFIFSKEEQKIVFKNSKEKQKKKIDLSNLEKDEKEAVLLLEKEGGAMFQSSLMEKLNSGKVKITRLLDKLEAKQIIERKRRGMNNIVVLRRS